MIHESIGAFAAIAASAFTLVAYLVVWMLARKTERIKVLVADDHPLYRSAIVTVIKHDARLELVAEVEDGRAALEAIREHQPDIAVLDMNMPELDGLEVLRAPGWDAHALPALVFAPSGSAIAEKARQGALDEPS